MGRSWHSTLRRGAIHCLPLLGIGALSCTIDPGSAPKKVEVETSASTQATSSGGQGTLESTSSISATGGDGDGSDGTRLVSETSETTGGSAATSAPVTVTSQGGGATSSTPNTGTTEIDTTTTQGVNTTTTSTSETSSTACANAEVNFEPVIPSVYLLVDRSGSMNWLIDVQQTAPDPADSRWEIVKTALIAPTNAAKTTGGVVARMEDKAKFALATYTTKNDCAVVDYAMSGNPPSASPELNNLAAITQRFNAAGPNGGTPSSEAIYAVWQEIKKSKDPNRILVFASDGDPSPNISLDCNKDGIPDLPEMPSEIASKAPKDRVVDVVRGMSQDGIKTFVIGVGPGASANHLDEVAKAGVGAADGADPQSAGFPANPVPGGTVNDDYFFAGTSSSSLYSAFESIIKGARPCKFKLSGFIKPGFESQGELTINGQAKTYNDPNGWKVTSPTEIEVLGSSCETIRNDLNVQLSVSFSCKAFVPG